MIPSEVTPKRRLTTVRFLLYTTVLFASFHFNLFGIRSGVYWATPALRVNYQGYDAAPVLWRLQAATDGTVSPLHPMVLVDRAGHSAAYLSQFGLQGVVTSLPVWAFGADPTAVADWAAIVMALASALVFATIYATAARRFGPLAGDLPTGATAMSPILLAVGPSIYWVCAGFLAPFAVAWIAYPWATGSLRRWVTFLSLIGVAVGLKALCGYEFITAVILAPVAGICAGQHACGMPLLKRIREAAAVGAVGVGGFAVAIGIHATQIQTVVGKSPTAITERATARTVRGAGRDEAAHPPQLQGVYDTLPEGIAYPVDCFLAFFTQPVASLPVWIAGSHGQLPLVWVVGVTAGLGVAVVVRRSRLPRELVGLAGAVGIGFGASLSWQVLAVNHMCVHRHLNLVVFFVPFLPLGFILMGAIGQRLVHRIGWEWVIGPVGLLTVALLAVGGIVSDRTRQHREATGEAEAVRAVEDVLSGQGLPAAPGRIHGQVDMIRPEPHGHYIVRVEHGRARELMRPATEVEPTLLLTGWAVDGLRLQSIPSARIVIVVDGQVVPVHATRYSRPDLDLVFRRPLLGTGFTAFVPVRLIPHGASVRVFAVSAADPSVVVELPGPGN